MNLVDFIPFVCISFLLYYVSLALALYFNMYANVAICGSCLPASVFIGDLLLIAFSFCLNLALNNSCNIWMEIEKMRIFVSGSTLSFFHAP